MKWIRKSTLEPLAVSMPGLKLGDRLLVMGCGDPVLIAALASKVGLTGRACAVDDDPRRATSAGRIAEREGALVETTAAPGWTVPYGDGSFDVVVIRMIAGDTPDARRMALQEARRVLRPGGRTVAIDGNPRRGLGALMGGGQSELPTVAEATGALVSAGFMAVRTVAERGGMLFVEGVKRNT